MRECTIGTFLYFFTIVLQVGAIPRAGIQGIQRTIAKQAVYFLLPLMTGKIFTVCILEKTIRILSHIAFWPPSKSSAPDGRVSS